MKLTVQLYSQLFYSCGLTTAIAEFRLANADFAGVHSSCGAIFPGKKRFGDEEGQLYKSGLHPPSIRQFQSLHKWECETKPR